MLDNREVRKFTLNKGVTTIGRAQDNDIVINNLALSRRHAELKMVGGGFEVVDLGSQNGVYVNSNRVRDGHRLGDEDTITLGTYNFVFREDEDDHNKRRPKRRRPSSTQAEEPDDYESDDQVPLLVLTYNDVELQRFPLRGETCLIGRAKECSVQIPERRLSRKHCQIVCNEGGRFFVKDLGSQNGTYVNRRRIRGFHELTHGDLLNFAEYCVTFLSDLKSYDGPDADAPERAESEPSLHDPVVARPPIPPGMAGEETVMPAAYSDEYGYVDEEEESRPVEPVEWDEEEPVTPAPPVKIRKHDDRKRARDGHRELPVGEPIIERPNDARARRREPARAIRETRRADEVSDRRVDEARRERRTEREDRARRDPDEPRRPRETEPPRRKEERPEAKPKRDHDRERDRERTAPPRPSKKKTTPPRKSREGKRPRSYEDDHELHDPELEDWYNGRDASALYDPLDADQHEDEEDSVLLPREASSVSHVLSTMMVDKRELDRNLKTKKKKKSKTYAAHVMHGDDEIFSGPLQADVTILGTDVDADIPLRGRYVAGRHSLLVQVRDSLLLVRLGSSSAARVNGLPKLQAFLKDGDVIQIDETTIEISEA